MVEVPVRPDDAADVFETLAVFAQDGGDVFVDVQVVFVRRDLFDDGGGAAFPVFADAEVEDEGVVFVVLDLGIGAAVFDQETVAAGCDGVEVGKLGFDL